MKLNIEQVLNKLVEDKVIDINNTSCSNYNE